MPAVIDPALPIAELLPIRLLVVTLQCLEQTSIQPFHQGPLSAFVRGLAPVPEEEFARLLRIDVPENGRTLYRAGELYRFPLYGLAGAEPVLGALIDALRRLPDSAPRRTEPIPFAGNWRLYGLADGLGEQPVERAADLLAYDAAALDAELGLWADRDAFQVRFLTPGRLRREKTQITEADPFELCRDAEDLPAHLLVARAHDSLADLLRRRGAERTPRGAPPALAYSRAHLFWLDVDYTPAQGKPQLLGGVAGRVAISGRLSPAWWRILVLGQLVGIGQRVGFGQGRYQLLTPEGEFSRPRVLPAASLLTRAAEPDVLRDAWRHVVAEGDILPVDPDDGEPAAGWPADTWVGAADDVDPDILRADTEPAPEDGAEADALDAPLDQLERDMARLAAGRYTAPELRGYLLPKRDGGVRPLAVPPLRDRVLQRAVQQTLARGIDRLFSRGSHGFRPGRSRITAADAIRAAWEQGYRWVYESDVRDFFDSVDLDRLAERLEALYGDDPVVPAVLGWMRAPVRYQGERIERRNGLPQGSPLSPLMANLMLDDFDSDMAAAGFHLIRFADDFIVLCKDPDEARRAGEAARASLAEHGLELHPDKTRITAMEDGFRYLGYLFVNDLVLDVSGAAAGGGGSVPPNSWLAQIATRHAGDINRKPALEALIERVATRPAAHIGERDERGALLCVTGEPCVIASRAKHLRVLRNDRTLHHLPWSALDAVVLFGNHQLTTAAMHEALRHDLPVHLATGMGSYRGVLWSGSPRGPGSALWLRQCALFADPEQCLAPAIAVVRARLRHMQEVLRPRERADQSRLDAALRAVGGADSLERLRGIEGSATRAYYLQLGAVLPADFAFERRTRRPPRDPFNVLLSLGYTLLYGYSDTMLRSAGLLPWQGFYHQGRGRHAALASDLMEPFRHIVEATALTVVNRRQIKAEDFSRSPAGACIMAAAARRIYLALLIDRFQTPVRALGDPEPATLLEHLHRQARSLRGWINGDSPFHAWRMR
jgi:group II intron reverse transcriptase/maturase/CRISPR-associated endonuclease Cas1